MLFLCTAVVGVVIAVESQTDGNGGLAMLEVSFQIFPKGFGDADQNTGESHRVLVFTVCQGFQLPVVFVDQGEGVAHLVGDLFFYLWKNRTTIQVNESISSYLFSAIRNRAINYQNQASVNREIHFSQYEELEDFSMFESKDSLPLEQIIEKELADRIRKSVNSLPMQTRKVFELKREQNFSYDEIALQLHISINTVRFHIKTAMKKLRVELGDYLTVLLLFLYKIL